MPTPLLFSRVTATLQSQLLRQCLPRCRLTTLTHNNMNQPPSVRRLRAALPRATSSEPLQSTHQGSSILGYRDASAKTFATKSVHQETEISRERLQVPLKGEVTGVPLVWLRDHCRCQACYNVSTSQKNVDSYSLKNLSVAQSQVVGDTLSVTWQDGHVSKYSLQWIADSFFTAGSQPERFLWDASFMRKERLPVTSFDLHMETEDGLKNTLQNLIKYGFAIVEGAPASVEGTELVTGRISFPLQTVYGSVSTMVSNELSHSDTAYTSVALGAHNDTTYFSVPAGVQVFHCLEHDGEGGHTLLVDGFHAAEELRRIDPASFRCLATVPVPHEYIEGSHYHLYSVATVLSTDVVSGQLTQIRFNPYDRAPLRTVSADQVAEFYSSYQALTQIIRRQQGELWIKLKAGMVLLVDNWRVMHGRSAFTGRRVLCGLYLPRDDWVSRARTMRLL
ncbi:trimethyllysine dioxygenase, mitochondrial-like [Babylonia areolata]|uniref:trimethyllysine dioxygenase, mitochondrial-like n=1 Tax=Babylonia areolata TaxID=304850 RepID=UPI003FD224FA